MTAKWSSGIGESVIIREIGIGACGGADSELNELICSRV